MVAAVYESGRVAPTVQARRDRVRGYLTLELDLVPTLREITPDGGGLAVAGPEQQVASVPDELPSSGPAHTVVFLPTGGEEWSLTVTAEPAGIPVLSWIVALAMGLVGVAAAMGVALRHRADRLNRHELERLQTSQAAVTSLALVAQQHLDLADVLPALATELAVGLDVRGITLSTAVVGGDRSLFTWGVPVPEGPLLVGMAQVDAGASVWLRLARSGRTAARLGVVVGSDLDEHDVRTLTVAGDVIAFALTNAEAFAQQQGLVDRMRAVDELKSVFLSTASHELRTPVVAIAGYSSLLNENWDVLKPDKARDLVDRVDRNAQRLSRMVEDLLDFSRIERGSSLAQEHEALDLGEVVTRVLADQPDLGRDHDLRVDAPDGTTVVGSLQAVERVVVNLVGNATKYTPQGTSIRVLVRSLDTEALLVVEDDGPGIAETDREQIFSRFYRGEGDEVTRTRGTGLGLAIVTEFALTMGGTARVEASDSGGARFVVTYPRVLARDTDGPLGGMSSAPFRSSTSGPTTHPSSSGGPRDHTHS
ncbi:HAMP domain-containing sensor histidine kinase [Nocardioides sp.]|uniref:sensor histidine kinase n=1 Tax=Nocardioides sp. TaxID=35761 RepID=UPI002B268090|nr:HAMP domain-containing sensor histidine kinase [Nocardioides sp.]